MVPLARTLSSVPGVCACAAALKVAARRIVARRFDGCMVAFADEEGTAGCYRAARTFLPFEDAGRPRRVHRRAFHPEEARMSSDTPVTTIFFDLGATLVEPCFTPDGGLDGFSELPGARAGLQALKAGVAGLGIISDTGDIAPQKVRDALAALGLLPLFTPELVLLS